MMYENKLVTCIKVGGKVLRELGDTVMLPFGAEYEILIKNLNTVRASVTVSVDGNCITGHTMLIVPAMGSISIERFIKDGNLTQGQKLKFIERTKKIENGPRGIRAEDGLIVVQFQFEEVAKHPLAPDYTWPNENSPWPEINKTPYLFRTADLPNKWDTSAIMIYNCSATPTVAQGITVGGSVSSQEFQICESFDVEIAKHSMVLKLVGQVSGDAIEKPITVKTVQECPTCATKNKMGAKFCHECGTGLRIT